MNEKAELDKILDYLTNIVVLELDNITIQYTETTEDTINGKVEHFVIQRRIY